MTKSEIVKEISARTGIDGKAVLAVVEGFINEVKTSLGKEENVYLRGFGSFIVKKRAQKTARNISKNTTMIIPAHNSRAIHYSLHVTNDRRIIATVPKTGSLPEVLRFVEQVRVKLRKMLATCSSKQTRRGCAIVS